MSTAASTNCAKEVQGGSGGELGSSCTARGPRGPAQAGLKWHLRVGGPWKHMPSHVANALSL
eukprot:CAMPEP_0202860542 /NCGR_PEP_ID=MMETSP1391-20130828/2208_1 /ASSEMBLY_ACC=CAM_ASM_000867 /TAXON_ID=1034604 /ORGANISM="Chlamydomonas leiostraca, Strain SAG 11-49" /LENGTH=61 /DNA_ID=CAMNT_0049539725 /DNA_START=10 /DNA_END=196 /DNA_ORIENTATION=+